ncbi:unnamed protein product [Cuscuta epithymum]|uniref:LysM domain-containing protein n=1 Tax=Cuscuta epithymum TaxID=186058 RepID=A0AAV0DPV0_9ASTE|nr:unnamed protein product [Cuscuta epithymum]CAH9126001.1 unnamed protein product [Cuscuta epithymum]
MASSFAPSALLLVWVVIVSTTIPSLLSPFLTLPAAEAQAFKCNRRGATCDAIVDYISPNATTLSAVKSLFNIKNLRSILGANSLPLNTPGSQTLPANRTLKIPFTCSCANGTGRSSNRLPSYTVAPGDGLYHIAAEVFGNLVTFGEIQAANNIPNSNLIVPGQKLWIPLPCSCDDVEGEKVVHYGHVVEAGSSVEAIAGQYNVSQDSLLKLNGLSSPKDLIAGAILDVPLPTCRSAISNASLDYPLLVPNGSVVFTAGNCVSCKCDAPAATAVNNWNLECQPTQLKSSVWSKCPSTSCQFGGSVNGGSSCAGGGNTTSGACTYAGYTNQTILTASLDSTCPQKDGGSALRPQYNWKWRLMLTLLCWTVCISSSYIF